jgi:hypothetical protein
LIITTFPPPPLALPPSAPSRGTLATVHPRRSNLPAKQKSQGQSITELKTKKKEDARSFECFFGFARFSYDEHDGQYNAYEQRARLRKPNR